MSGSGAKERLARRAKTRRWIDRWKKRLLTLLILIVVAILGVATQAKRLREPLLKQINDYYDLHEEPMPDGLKRMYQLGRFLEITLQDEEALDCYMTIFDLTYDGPMVFDSIKLQIPDEEDALYSPTDDPVVGYAIAQYEKMLGLKFKQKAQATRAWYLRDIAPLENSDPEINHLMQTSYTLYRAGS